MTRRVAFGISVLWIPLAFLYDGLTVLVLPVKVAGPGAAFAIGVISFLGLAAALVVQPLAGLVGDRLRGRVDRRAFAALSAVPILVGLWVFAGATTAAVVAVAYVIVEVSASVLQSAVQTLIPEHAGETIGRAAGLKGAFDVGGSFLAFLAIGAMLAGGDVAPATLLVATVVIVGVAIAWLLVPSTRAASPANPVMAERPTVRRALPDGFGRLVVSRFLFLLGTYAVGRFLVLLIAARLGIDPSRAADETGGFLALFTLVTAGGALIAGPLVDRRGPLPLVRAGAAVSAIGILAFLLPAGVIGMLVAGCLMAVGTAAFVTANWGATARLVPAGDAGRLMAIANIGTGGAAACAGLLGPLVDVAGFGPALVVAACASVAALVAVAPPAAVTRVELRA